MTILHGNTLVGYLKDRMSVTCFNACVKNFSTPDLSIDEASCIDRCSLKFFDVYNSINNMIEETLKRTAAAQNPTPPSNTPQ